MSDFEDLIRQFATACQEKFSNLYGAQPEDQLKPAVGGLLEALGPLVNREIKWRTEVRDHDVGGRPDMGVIVNGLLTGHIELKSPDVGARPENFKGENGKQFERFKALPNLIYTDGSEWSLYRMGERLGRIRIATDIRDGDSAILSDSLTGFRTLLAEFADWEPITPSNPRRIAEFVAPLSRILRDEVEWALERGNRPLHQLAQEWRRTLFPEADDAQFADSYAQTLTYALLLAQFEGADTLDPYGAIPKLQGEHALLASALQLLEAPQVRDELLMPIALLERVIGAIDGTQLEFTSGHWLYFYEDFLAAYDPALRKDRGVYFTPIEVVECQVRLAAELLRTRFGKPLGFADESVQILDPAVGTGTYPLAIIDHAAASVAEQYGQGAVPERMKSLADRLQAFELLVGPYAVARLRITQRLHEMGATEKSARVYLADTLSSPNTLEKFPRSLLSQPMTDDRKAAQEVKNEHDITVCIGNPPYDRGKKGEAETGKEGPGGWVVHGDIGPDSSPLLESFTAPVVAAGQGGQLKNLYNSYVYFWRWALWKVFESPDYQGIVTFITASSYLRGPGFTGMRRVMRETFDELWIIDLEGDNFGSRKSENVFVIESPVAIAIGIRNGVSDRGTPATTKKVRLRGSAKQKLNALCTITDISSVEWHDCSDVWDAPFFPLHNRAYADLPSIKDIFPWQHSGSQMKRTWPIGEQEALLRRRWSRLILAPREQKALLFHESRDRKIEKNYQMLFGENEEPKRIVDIKESSPRLERYSYRSLDRQWVVADARVGDFLRPDLWRSRSPGQVFITSLLTDVLGRGPAMFATDAVPDLHSFSGRGAKDTIPLYRDAVRAMPNVTDGVLQQLQSSAEALFAYAYGIMGHAAYVERFWEELELPPPHLPITKERGLFRRVAEHGRRLIYLHTYGARFAGEGDDGSVPQGSTRCEVAVSQTVYPNSFSYDEQTLTLHVGDGEFRPVSREVYEYSVSGLQVVKSWLGYRMKDRKGRKSSPLDDIRPETWTFTEELLELLWVLEHTIALEPVGKALLDEVLESELWTAAELPKPTEAERKAPKAQAAVGDQLGLGV